MKQEFCQYKKTNKNSYKILRNFNIITLLIFFYSLINISECSLTLQVSQKTINMNSIYNFSIIDTNLRTITDNTAYLEFVFNSEHFAFTVNQVYSCFNTDNNSILYTCKASTANIIQVMNPFFNSSVVKISIVNIKNPSSTVRPVFTYNFRYASTLLISTLISASTSYYIPGALQNCSLSFSPSMVFSSSTLTITIKLGNQIPANGSITVAFPSTWLDQANSSYNPLSSGSRSCVKLSTEVYLNNPLSCTTNQPTVFLFNSFNATTPSGTILTFSISNIFTPSTVSNLNTITISTLPSTQVIYITDQTICNVPSLSSRTISNIIPKTTFMVGVNASTPFAFTSPTAISGNDRIIFSSSSPNDTFFYLYGISSGYISSSDGTIALLSRFSTSLTSVQLSFASSMPTIGENIVIDVIQGLYIQPLINSGKRSLTLSLKRNNSLYALNTFQLTIQPNNLTNISIIIDNSVVSSVSTYTFAFTITNSLAAKSKIIIVLPSQLSTPNGACLFTLTLANPLNLNSTASCTVTSNKNIELNSININTLNAGQRIIISIQSITNSQTTELTNPFAFSTYYADTSITTTDSNTVTRVKMTSALIGSASIVSSSAIVSAESVYTVTYTIRTKFLANSVVQLKIPSQISLGNSGSLSALFNIRYINSTTTTDQACLVRNFTLNSFVYIQLSGISTVSLPSLTIITFKISSLINPLSLKPSSSFGLYQLDSKGNQIQRLQTGLTITNTQSNSFNVLYSGDSVVRMNGASDIYPIYLKSTITLQVKDYIQISLQNTNNVDSQIYFSNPFTSLDIQYNNANNIRTKLNSTFQRLSDFLIKINLNQQIVSGTTYILSLNTIKRSRTAENPSNITIRSYKYVTSTSSFLISSGMISPQKNNKQNAISKITLSISTTPSQLFSYQQFSITIDTKSQIYARDYLIIQVPSLYLFNSSIININSSTTNLSTVSSQSLCSNVQYFCSNYQGSANRIKVQELVSGGAFSNLSTVTINVKDNLYRSPSTFNYKGYYFKASTYSSTNLIIDGTLQSGSSATNLSKAQFYLTCNINQSINHCKTCNSIGNCISCYQPVTINSIQYTFDGYKIPTDDSKCVNNCSNGYFLNPVNGICTACISPCLTCDQSTTKCLSCIQSITLNKYFGSNNTCLSLCPSGYYADISNICTLCNSNCASCSVSAFNCLTCSGTLYLNPSTNTCVSSNLCPFGTFGNLTTNKCQTCDVSCSGCISTSKNCSSCSTGYIQDFSNTTFKNCTNKCPTGTVNDTVNNLGCKCQTQCKTCQSKTSTCTSCDSSSQFKYLYSNSCVGICPQGTYLGNISNINTCTKCAETNCKVCTVGGICTQCSGLYFLYQSACIDKCQSNSVITITNGIRKCLKCLIGCINCDKGVNQCTTCQSGYLKQGNSTNTYCVTKCSSGYVNFNNTVCYTSCPTGYYDNSGKCELNNNGTNTNTNSTKSQLTSTRTVPFPFTIASVILISSIFLCKLVLPFSLVSNMIISLIGLLQVISWIIVIIVCYFQTSSGIYWTNNQIGIYLLAIAIGINNILNIVAFIFFYKYIYKDFKFTQMFQYNNKKLYFGKCPTITTFILSILFSHKMLQFLFSNFLGSKHFSYKVNSVISMVPLNYILFSSILPSILAIAGGSLISYQLQNEKTDSASFIASIDMIIVTILGIVTAIWISNRSQKDYEVDIHTTGKSGNNYTTQEILVQGNPNHQYDSNLQQVFMQQSGIRNTNMSFDKQKNYYYKNSMISQNDQDHMNEPLTKRKNNKDKKANFNDDGKRLRNSLVTDDHSSQALVIAENKKRRNLQDQFSPEVNEAALNSKQDIEIIQFYKENGRNSELKDIPLISNIIHYPKNMKPQQLLKMSPLQKEQFKQKMKKQLEKLGQKQRNQLQILKKQKQLTIKRKKAKIDQISAITQKQVQQLQQSQKQKVHKIKSAVDLLKRKQIKIQEYLLYNQIIKEEQGQYDNEENDQNDLQISMIKSKGKFNKDRQEDDHDLQEVIKLSPKKMQLQPNQLSDRTRNMNQNQNDISGQKDRQSHSKQKTIKKQSNKKKNKNNTKANKNKVNDLHVYYKYDENKQDFNGGDKQFDSESQPELPKLRANVLNKNALLQSQKNMVNKIKNSQRDDILMIDVGTGRQNKTDLLQGQLQQEYTDTVPPRLLHSTEKIQHHNKSPQNMNKNSYGSQHDRQTLKSFQNQGFDLENQISPTRFDIQNQRFEQLDQISEIPIRPKVLTFSQSQNQAQSSKNPTKRYKKNDGFEIYDTDQMNQIQQEHDVQGQSRLTNTMNRYSSAHQLDYNAILRKNQQYQKLKRLQQIYLPRLQTKVQRKKKRNNLNSQNSQNKDKI